MKIGFAVILAVHGVVHLLGFVKAFGLAALPQLSQPVSPSLGVLWLAAAALFCAAAVSLFAWPHAWWVIGACAVTVSTAVIVSAWSDAKFGALMNVVAVAGVFVGFMAQGPVSLRAQFNHDVERGLAGWKGAQTITDADLARLPDPVRRYLHAAGVAVGQPRIRNFHVRMHGRIRNGPAARWMPLQAEQYSFVDGRARLFYLTGSMFTVPVQGYHRYTATSATMSVKAAGVVPVVEMSGQEMLQAETVTMFNDMCIMAPATLVDPAIVWKEVDAHTSRASFTSAGQTIHAELSFNDAGELTNFWSDDRYQISPDGKTLKKVRWSTPVGHYRPFGDTRLASVGEARWHEGGGDDAYIELVLDEVEYNVPLR